MRTLIRNAMLTASASLAALGGFASAQQAKPPGAPIDPCAPAADFHKPEPAEGGSTAAPATGQQPSSANATATGASAATHFVRHGAATDRQALADPRAVLEPPGPCGATVPPDPPARKATKTRSNIQNN